MEKTVQIIQQHIDALLQRQTRILIAIDGSCTAGKTTLTEKLRQRYDCNVFHMDDFFLRPEQRTQSRLEEVGGNVDYERFREEVLLPLRSGQPFFYRPYDCGTGCLKDAVSVTPKAINMIEGTYSQHPYFGNVYDLKVVLKVSPERRTERIYKRPAFLQKRFFEEWIPMEQRYFAQVSIEAEADLLAQPEDNR